MCYVLESQILFVSKRGYFQRKQSKKESQLRIFAGKMEQEKGYPLRSFWIYDFRDNRERGKLGGVQEDVTQAFCNQVSEVVFCVFFSWGWF